MHLPLLVCVAEVLHIRWEHLLPELSLVVLDRQNLLLWEASPVCGRLRSLHSLLEDHVLFFRFDAVVLGPWVAEFEGLDVVGSSCVLLLVLKQDLLGVLLDVLDPALVRDVVHGRPL